MALYGYFDDSGTHTRSPIVLWGGLIGYDEQWEYLEREWMKPLGDRGLASFHMAECEAGDGPYGTRAERDRLTYELREAIIRSELFKLGGAVAKQDWDELVVGRAREALGDAEDASLHYLIMNAMDFAHREHDALTMFFDARVEKMAAIESLLSRYNRSLGRTDSAEFVVAQTSPAIQAADMVVWEMRNHMLRTVESGESDLPPRPHFKTIVDQGGMIGGLMARAHIVELLGSWAEGPPNDGLSRVIEV